MRADGYLVWPDAFGQDAHMLRRFQEDGFEDFVAFDTAPEAAELRYVVRLDSNVAGLRLVADTLEFLDADGAPRLRVARPSISSSDGTEHEARLNVVGCDVDQNPSPPWGRPIVAPGAAECTVLVTWDPEAVSYPALVDPAWVTTGNMIQARNSHTAHLLPSGKVLVVGGSGGTGKTLQTAELFDPATKTWAATGSMADARHGHTSHLLADGRVLVAGGASPPVRLARSETYSPSTGTWTPVGSMSEARYLHMGTTLMDGRVLITGGRSTADPPPTEIFNPQTNAWVAVGAASAAYWSATPITLADGRVLLAGGVTENGCAASAEIFNPGTNTWAPTGSLAAPRCDYVGRLLPDGTVIVAAGGSDFEVPIMLDTVEIFKPTTGTWRTSVEKLPTTTGAASVALLPTGSMLVSGGVDTSFSASRATSFYHLGSISSWHTLGELRSARLAHTATALDATHVLVAGGQDRPLHPTNSAEILTLDTEQQAEGAQRAMALSMTWSNANMVRSASNAPIGVLFRNDTGADVLGTLHVVARTPDGRRVRRFLRTTTVPRCRTSTGGPCPTANALQPDTSSASNSATTLVDMQNWLEELNLNDIPSQPVGHDGAFYVEFLPANQPGISLRTSPAFYQYTPGYAAVQLNGFGGAEGLRTPKSFADTDTYFADVTPWLSQLETPSAGRIWNGTTWEDIRTGIPKGDDFEVVGGARITGPFNVTDPGYGPPEALHKWIYPWKSIEYRFLPAEGHKKVCAFYNPEFMDGGRGETHGNGRIPAVYAKASVLASTFVPTLPNGSFLRRPIWTGRLDADGCSPSMYLEAAYYTMIVTAEMERPDGTSVVVNEKVGTGPAKPVTWAVSFNNFIPTINVRPPIELDLPASLGGNAAAVAARLLMMEQDGPPNGRYQVFVYPSANYCTSYGKKVGAALFTDGIYLCPNDDARPDEHNANFKFVIAHEFGHYVERFGAQIPWPRRQDVYSYKDHPSIPALCSCNGFIPGDMGLHCLQSQEVYAAGSKEGFAHFYATLMWNDPSASSPRFQYYKAFREPSNTVTPAGSKVVNVRQNPPLKWSDTHCASTAAGRSTEYDFLGFYWSINTAAPSARTSLSDLQAIMTALADSPLDPAHEGSWNAYQNAAATVFGTNSAKFQKFFADGSTFGVDH